MRPVEQTRLTPQEGGNCLAACMASILECPLDEVPQLPPGDAISDETWAEYHPRLAAWLAERNLVEVTFSADQEWHPQGYAILGVESPRFPGMGHAVVALDGVIVWDPHPGRDQGVGKRMNWGIFQVLDPAKCRAPSSSDM